MIFQQLVVHNFSLYKGRQELTLSPKPGKPIVLIGGLNGAGKTTILDAIQLVLFGRNARCAARGDLKYEEFLRQSIHRSVKGQEGAAVELEFSHVSQGTEHRYRVHRSWRCIGDTVKEQIEVVVDGHMDPMVTANWGDFAEEFMPARIAHLFLFDGEKIEGLADLERSSELLQIALKSLLGLDLVDKLRSDLVAYERRKSKTLGPKGDQGDIDSLQEQLESHDAKLQSLTLERGSAA